MTARPTGWNVSAATTVPDAQRITLQERAAAAWAQREDAASLAIAIEAWNELGQTGDVAALTSLSRAFFFKADCHARFEDDPPFDMATLFNDGAVAGEMALTYSSDDFRDRVSHGTPLVDAMVALPDSSIEALYWRTLNLYRWSEQQNLPTRIDVRDEARAIMERALRVNPDLDQAGPQRFFGEHYARAEQVLGGDLPRSDRYFVQANRRAPDYLENLVQFAFRHDLARRDRAAFVARLEQVEDATIETNEFAPENRCAQKKARWLMAADLM